MNVTELAADYTSFQDYLEAVRRAADIVTIIGADTTLVPDGKGLKGLSPLRTEKSPSFYVYPGDQRWHDFGTGEHGDVFDYVKRRDGITDVVEATHRLADRFGVPRPGRARDAYDKEIEGLLERRWIEDLMTEIAIFYHRKLPSKLRAEYMKAGYGLTDETIDRLKLGWSSGTGLEHHLMIMGFTEKQIIRSGFFVRRGDGSIVEFYDNRLVFPYWKGGKVVYAIGRRVEGLTSDAPHEKGKYKKLLTHNEAHPYVSKFISNQHFYNEDAARRGGPELLITEGVTDCIAAMQAGIPVISPVTVRFAARDLERVAEHAGRFTRTLICNDTEANHAGEKGAMATAQFLFERRVSVWIAKLPMPEGQTKTDVNEYLRAHTPAEFREVLGHAATYLDAVIDAASTLGDTKETVKGLLRIVRHAEPIDRERYFDAIAKRFTIKRRTLNETLRTLEDVPGQLPGTPPADAAPASAAPASAPAAPKGPLGSERIEGAVHEDEEGYYFTQDAKGVNHVISSFVVEPKRVVSAPDGGFILIADFVPQRGPAVKDHPIPRTAWHSKRDFLRALPSADLQWTGDDNNVQGLLRWLTKRDVARCKGTANLGYLDTPEGPRWVVPGFVISPEGVGDDRELTYVPTASTLHTRLQYRATSHEDAAALAQEAFPLLLGVNRPEVVLPMLAWFFAAPFKPRLMKLLHHFPILFVWGTQGSGKSAILRDVFWKMSGMAAKSEPYSVTETDFATMAKLSTTNSIPTVFDEYKPNDMPKGVPEKKHRMWRRAYGGETEERGRSDLSIRGYDLRAPICIAGEQLPDGDPALRERLISVCPSKNTVNDPRFAEVFHSLTTLPLDHLAVPYIQWMLGRDTEADLDDARAITKGLLDRFPAYRSRVTARPFDNLLTIVFGLRMFEAFAEHLGVADVEIAPDMIEPCIKAALVEITESDAGAKDAFDGFLERLSALAHTGILREGVHYARVGERLCLHLPTCHDVYLGEQRKSGRDDATNGMRALRRIAAEKMERGSYLVELDQRVTMNGRQVRCVALDPARVPATLDVDEFPIGQERAPAAPRWGAGSGWEGASRAFTS